MVLCLCFDLLLSSNIIKLELMLCDVQPLFSPSILVDMMRPDGSSIISVLNGESLSADLAHELLGIQVYAQ